MGADLLRGGLRCGVPPARRTLAAWVRRCIRLLYLWAAIEAPLSAMRRAVTCVLAPVRRRRWRGWLWQDRHLKQHRKEMPHTISQMSDRRRLNWNAERHGIHLLPCSKYHNAPRCTMLSVRFMEVGKQVATSSPPCWCAATDHIFCTLSCAQQLWQQG